LWRLVGDLLKPRDKCIIRRDSLRNQVLGYIKLTDASLLKKTKADFAQVLAVLETLWLWLGGRNEPRRNVCIT
jgi:hypothetical protein